MGMVDIGKAIPKLRLRLPPIQLLFGTDSIEPLTQLYETGFISIALSTMPRYNLNCKRRTSKCSEQLKLVRHLRLRPLI
jgi:hypothetical protein